MNKKRVNQWIPLAKEALTTVGIAQNEQIISTYRSQISEFGASIILSGLKPAVAFFSSQGNSTTERPKLLSAMYCIITGDFDNWKNADVLQDVCKASNINELREQFIDASIALKLAMNFFDLKDKDKEEV